MARDRPSPYDEGEAFFTVARGPVPRERWSARTMARDRPSPYGEGAAFFTVARGLSPASVGVRGRWRREPARMRVWHARAQALREGEAFFHSGAGPVTATLNEL